LVCSTHLLKLGHNIVVSQYQVIFSIYKFVWRPRKQTKYSGNHLICSNKAGEFSKTIKQWTDLKIGTQQSSVTILIPFSFQRQLFSSIYCKTGNVLHAIRSNPPSPLWRRRQGSALYISESRHRQNLHNNAERQLLFFLNVTQEYSVNTYITWKRMCPF
jgi:hypothetical protein